MGLIRGELPTWMAGYGDGYGYGAGYGYGDGYGDGDGDGDGVQLVSCSPTPVKLTAADLVRAKACDSGVALFVATFPDGATWPTDRDRAVVAGLDVRWAEKALGLLRPVP